MIENFSVMQLLLSEMIEIPATRQEHQFQKIGKTCDYVQTFSGLHVI